MHVAIVFDNVSRFSVDEAWTEPRLKTCGLVNTKAVQIFSFVLLTRCEGAATVGPAILPFSLLDWCPRGHFEGKVIRNEGSTVENEGSKLYETDLCPNERSEEMNRITRQDQRKKGPRDVKFSRNRRNG